jgi:hypothetical protein
MIIYDEQKRLDSLENQFGKRTIEEVKASEKYKAFFAYWKEGKQQPKTMQDFYKLVDSEDKDFLPILKKYAVEVRETKDPLPVFLWLSDDRRAIFSFYNYGDNPREVSFQTNDPQLIAVLKQIAEEDWKKLENKK